MSAELHLDALGHSSYKFVGIRRRSSVREIRADADDVQQQLLELLLLLAYQVLPLYVSLSGLCRPRSIPVFLLALVQPYFLEPPMCSKFFFIPAS